MYFETSQTYLPTGIQEQFLKNKVMKTVFKLIQYQIYADKLISSE